MVMNASLVSSPQVLRKSQLLPLASPGSLHQNLLLTWPTQSLLKTLIPPSPQSLLGSQVLTCSRITLYSLWALLQLSWLAADHDSFP